MLLSTPTRVPAPPVIPTRIPAGVSTPVSPGVPLSVPTVPPSIPSIPTQRPYMYGLKLAVAAQAVQVLSVAGVKILVSAGESVAFPSWSSAVVSGGAVLRAAFPRAAVQSAQVSNTAVLRPTLPVVSSTVVSGAAAVRAAYPRPAGSSTAVAGSAAVKALYGRTAANTTSVSGSAALTPTNIIIFRDDFDEGVLSGWTAKNGAWAESGGLAMPATANNNTYITRAIDTPRTTVVGECLVTASPDNVAAYGAGVVLFTSPALDMSASLNLYARPNGWFVRINGSDVVGSTGSNPMRSRINVTPSSVRFYIADGLAYTYNQAVTVYGIGVYCNGGSTDYRADWVEARIP